jgi:hypothetical protein
MTELVRRAFYAYGARGWLDPERLADPFRFNTITENHSMEVYDQSHLDVRIWPTPTCKNR